jgi:hypothetical protein
MAYTTIDDPTSFFNTVLWTGNNTARTITGVGYQPDWVWIKRRSATSDHLLYDATRGVQKTIKTNAGDAEITLAQGLTGFAADGFSIGTDGDINNNTSTYVAWNWLAGGSASSNSNGGITSSVSVNTTSGFSIVSYTGTGSAATVGHGLSSKPELMIFKNRDRSANWVIYHHELNSQPEQAYIYFSTMGGRDGYSGFFNSTAPTSSVFSIGTDSDFNSSGEKMIGYCFHSVKGFSKFGSYTGNGNADGPFVYLGFKPAFVIIKQIGTDGISWQMRDNKRDSFNDGTRTLFPDTNDSESSGGTSYNLDYLSNGIKIRTTHARYNSSGVSYIYIAFAESPLVNSKGVPNNAR